jgi:oxalate decarboxylase/phosphoglucose isomerase-like protein (cupin superfamily)
MSDYLKIPFKIFDRSDERGFSFSLDDLPLSDFHIVSMRPGKRRGDHVHDYTEVACIIGGTGSAEVIIEQEEGTSRLTVDQDFFVVTFQAGVSHTIYNSGEKEFYLVCFSYK